MGAKRQTTFIADEGLIGEFFFPLKSNGPVHWPQQRGRLSQVQVHRTNPPYLIPHLVSAVSMFHKQERQNKQSAPSLFSPNSK